MVWLQRQALSKEVDPNGSKRYNNTSYNSGHAIVVSLWFKGSEFIGQMLMAAGHWLLAVSQKSQLLASSQQQEARSRTTQNMNLCLSSVAPVAKEETLNLKPIDYETNDPISQQGGH